MHVTPVGTSLNQMCLLLLYGRYYKSTFPPLNPDHLLSPILSLNIALQRIKVKEDILGDQVYGAVRWSWYLSSVAEGIFCICKISDFAILGISYTRRQPEQIRLARVKMGYTGLGVLIVSVTIKQLYIL